MPMHILKEYKYDEYHMLKDNGYMLISLNMSFQEYHTEMISLHILKRIMCSISILPNQEKVLSL